MWTSWSFELNLTIDESARRAYLQGHRKIINRKINQIKIKQTTKQNKK